MAKRHEERLAREDRRSGEIVAMLYNVNRNDEVDPHGWTWRDVFPQWKEPPREQTEDEMFQAMMLFRAAHNGGVDPST